MINVGGYKVNPHEVEEEIKKVDGVIDVLVKARTNRITGNILVAEIKNRKNISIDIIEQNVYSQLNEHLQPYKIPRILDFVDNISQTRSGKKGRD